MAKLKDLLVRIGLSKEGLRKLNNDLRTTKHKFRNNFGEIASMAKNSALVITGTLAAGVTALIRQGAKMEKLRTGFISIAGGANKAAAIVKELNEFTATTPFQLEQVSVAARQLLAVGTKRSDLQKELRMLGDIAASSGNSIEDIAAIFAKVQAKGKVELENLNQLAERGIPIFNQLRTVTGDANMEFGAGAVSVEQFNDALRSMVEEGGLASGAMENLSDTVEGRISTLMDNLSLELGGFAEKTGLTDAFSGLLKDTTEALQGISGVTQSEVAAALGQAEEAMEGFGSVSMDNLEEVESTMAKAQASIANLIAATEGTGTRRTGLAFLFGGVSGAKESMTKQVNAAKMLLDVQEQLGLASVNLNNQVLAGLVPQSTATEQTNEQVTADKEQKKAKEQLVAVERSHINQLGNLKPLISDTAVQTMAGVQANHQLKGSYEQLNASLEPVFGRFRQLGAFAKNQLPQFFQGAFQALSEGTKSFGDFMLQTLQRLLVKAAALVATFAVLSIMMGGATGVAELTGGKAGLKFFMAGGMGIPQMADGGLFTGASLAMVGEGPGTSAINPEVVAPLDKLQQMMGGGAVNVTGTIRGRDLLLSEERSAYSRRRKFGN
jgi:hypothetical protein